MGIGDNIRNKAEEVKGKAKEGFGDLTDNEQLEAEGKLDQGKAQAKQVFENAKESVAEAFNDATDGRR